MYKYTFYPRSLHTWPRGASALKYCWVMPLIYMSHESCLLSIRVMSHVSASALKYCCCLPGYQQTPDDASCGICNAGLCNDNKQRYYMSHVSYIMSHVSDHEACLLSIWVMSLICISHESCLLSIWVMSHVSYLYESWVMSIIYMSHESCLLSIWVMSHVSYLYESWLMSHI